jgi:hypothetical protein
MGIGEIQQIQAAEQFYPSKLDEVHGEDRRHDPENEGTDQTVLQRLIVAILRQPEDHHRDHERVVGAQQAFERDQQTNGDKIGGLNRRQHGLLV